PENLVDTENRLAETTMANQDVEALQAVMDFLLRGARPVRNRYLSSLSHRTVISIGSPRRRGSFALVGRPKARSKIALQAAAARRSSSPSMISASRVMARPTWLRASAVASDEALGAFFLAAGFFIGMARNRFGLRIETALRLQAAADADTHDG
ncbi:MAG: hypothetical protein HOL85_08445, partial [Rhodospirillaceae bacterium]|nr:hypothetical protein [Rhodospirillaceae bacterium]